MSDRSENFNEIQIDRSRSSAGPILIVLVIALLSLLPVGTLSGESNLVRARAKAEVLGYQVIQLYRESEGRGGGGIGPVSSSPAQHRLPASDPAGPSAEGLMGKDPWGQAYRYRLVRNQDERMMVEMVSPGPDLEFDSASGDDITVTLSF